MIRDDEEVVYCYGPNLFQNFHLRRFTGHPTVQWVPSGDYHIINTLWLQLLFISWFKNLTLLRLNNFTKFPQCPISHSTWPSKVLAGQSTLHGGGWYSPGTVLLNVYWMRRTDPFARLKWKACDDHQTDKTILIWFTCVKADIEFRMSSCGQIPS